MHCLVADIGRRLREKTGDAGFGSFLSQRTSVEIQTGNAASIAGTIPSARWLDELFLLS